MIHYSTNCIQFFLLLVHCDFVAMLHRFRDTIKLCHQLSLMILTDVQLQSFRYNTAAG